MTLTTTKKLQPKKPVEMRRYKAVSKCQLKDAYNISYNTLKKWLTPYEAQIGTYSGQAYTPKQMKTIVDCIGEPEHLHLISVS